LLVKHVPDYRLDHQSPIPLHAQAAAALRRAIADGEAKPGERLPPARDLAGVMGVNTNTVLRALRTLRDEGLLDFRRGRGITVANATDQASLLIQARELVALAQNRGYQLDELITLIKTVSA
jgi:GntR family transcriptional regulator